MPGMKIKGSNGYAIYMDWVGTYKPGDPAPDGYCDRIEWHKVQERAGYRQKYCHCGKWLYDFEKCKCKNPQRLTQRQLNSIDAAVRRQLKAEGKLRD